jgi:hypothetical protein
LAIPSTNIRCSKQLPLQAVQKAVIDTLIVAKKLVPLQLILSGTAYQD